MQEKSTEKNKKIDFILFSFFIAFMITFENLNQVEEILEDVKKYLYRYILSHCEAAGGSQKLSVQLGHLPDYIDNKILHNGSLTKMRHFAKEIELYKTNSVSSHKP